MSTTSETITTPPLATEIDAPFERLLAFEPVPLPVISVYLNTQPDPHGRDPELIPYLQREFKALARTWPATSPERRSFDRDVEKIITYVGKSIDPAANGVAIFACQGADEFFEALQFSAPVSDNRIYVYHQPHLYHLMKLDEQYPRYAAVVTDANTARIFVFGLGQTIDIEEIKGRKVHRVKVGGWSQARYQRRVGNAHQQHVKEVVERLEKIVQEEKITRLIVAGEPSILPLIEQEFPQELAAMANTMKLDVHASEQEVLKATLEKLRQEESSAAAEKAQRLFDETRARGLAVAGPEHTLAALANGQVDELLISGSMEQQHPDEQRIEAILAPEIPDSTGGALNWQGLRGRVWTAVRQFQ
ncbi:MAG TPA: Vms1/Ankzf1 family peptidyl-tRNA hydrolase [Bryobacteraceae bacterium]|nr:Vms1/Ankzf1 family peptidyl-tRNA hydrolase [Bryobacteraceae bacterium]